MIYERAALIGRLFCFFGPRLALSRPENRRMSRHGFEIDTFGLAHHTLLMSAQLAIADQMTVEEFLDFAGARPDWEKWELIEGRPTMSPSPTDWHQLIVQNLGAAINTEKQRLSASWIALPGIGTRVPVAPNSLPQPDLFVKEGPLTGLPTTDDAPVIVEVLSRSNTPADQAWRRRVYGSVPNCQHYVTVTTARAEVARYDRASNWTVVKAVGLQSSLELPALSAAVALADIYRWTPIA